MKVKELAFMVTDELKLYSDDSVFTEDHIIFLLNLFRSFLLKLRYADIKKQVPESNYLTICLNLELVDAISGEPCEGSPYLRSTIKVPNTMKIGNTSVFPLDFYQGKIAFINRDRMKYVGYNKYLLNIIYCSLGPDGYLYFKSSNPQFLYLKKVKMSGIFENIEEAGELQCADSEGNKICDFLDLEFPIESALTTTLIQLVVKELAGPSWRPEDDNNNASDDLSNLANFIAKNMKSSMQKLIEE